jgi:hypothetical protein
VRFEGEMGFGRYRGRKGWWVDGENMAMEMDMVWMEGGLRVWAILSSASEMAKLLVSTLNTFAASMTRLR